MPRCGLVGRALAQAASAAVLCVVATPGRAAADTYDVGWGVRITREQIPGLPNRWVYTSIQNLTGQTAYDFHFYLEDAQGRTTFSQDSDRSWNWSCPALVEWSGLGAQAGASVAVAG